MGKKEREASGEWPIKTEHLIKVDDMEMLSQDETCLDALVLSFENKLAHPAISICLLIHVTSKRIEQEGPGWSDLVRF